MSDISVEYLKGYRDHKVSVIAKHDDVMCQFSEGSVEYDIQKAKRDRLQAQVDCLNDLINLNENR